MSEALVSQTIDLPGGELRLLQPQEASELPDKGAVEWAPLAPYWAVLWRSGVALARELDGEANPYPAQPAEPAASGNPYPAQPAEPAASSSPYPAQPAEPAASGLGGLRVVELGCGLAVPSIAAARAGASVLATDACPEALALAARNAEANGVRIETARVDWSEPGDLARLAPFDLVLAADVLYERGSVAALLSLLPRLAPEAWLADPGRPAEGAFLGQASRRWTVDTRVRGVVRIHRLRLA